MIPARVPRACLQLLDAVTLAEVPAQMGLDPSGASTLVFVASQVRDQAACQAFITCSRVVQDWRECLHAGLCRPVCTCVPVHACAYLCVFPIMCA